MRTYRQQANDLPAGTRNLNRREFVSGALGAASGVAAPLVLAMTSAESELGNPEKLLAAYQRLSGSFDDRLIIWWMSGTRYGVVDAKVTALYGMEVGMFHRWYRQADGSFKAAFFELTYYTDPSTNTLLREFANPYTGRTDRVSQVRLGPEVRELTAAGLGTTPSPLLRSYRSSLGPAVVNGATVWIPSSVEAAIKFPKPSAPEILINIYTTVQGSLREALDDRLISANCTLEFHNVLKWEPWMQMGDHPGHMMSTASGRKLESVEELPPRYLAMAEEVHGKYIADPATRLAKLAVEQGLAASPDA